jgi:hypothetical protein
MPSARDEVIQKAQDVVASYALVVTSAAQCTSVGDLRERLGLDYARFNAVLKDLGSPYAPVHNQTGHAQALEHHVQMHREQITTGLRARFLDAFRGHQPLDDYVAIRDLRSVQPDPAWLDNFDIPPDGDRVSCRALDRAAGSRA